MGLGGFAVTDRLGQQVGYRSSERFAFLFLEFLQVVQYWVADIYSCSHGALMIIFYTSDVSKHWTGINDTG